MPYPSSSVKSTIRQAFLSPHGEPVTADGESLLGIMAFDAECPAGLPDGLPRASIPLRTFGKHPGIEAWCAAGEVEYGAVDNIRYARGDEMMFGVISSDAERLEDAVKRTYREVIRVARGMGYPALVRMWNYFPDINVEAGGLERYRKFCIGRYQAFAETGYAFGDDLPAASAIGSLGGDLWVSFLAARRPPIQIENPRQISAYRYPREYGPRSPSFSRAMLHAVGEECCLFMSGTASIRRHETIHVGDVLRQCEATQDNLRTLLRRVGLNDPLDLGKDATWKVYLRHVSDYEPVRAYLRETLSPASPTLFLSGHICRRDLLLEMEGVVRFPRRDFAVDQLADLKRQTRNA